MFRKERLEGGQMPFFYGYAWYHPSKMVDVCYPFGLHILARVIRKLYYALMWGLKTEAERKSNSAIRKSYNQGFKDGKQSKRAL